MVLLRNKAISTARIIATILVIVGHAISPFAEEIYSRFNLKSEILNGLHSYIYSFHMPLFFIISGAVFYMSVVKRIGDIDLLVFLKKKVLRLLIPLVFIKFCILTPVKYAIDFYNVGFLPKNIIEHYIRNTDVGHLWYLFVLFLTESVFFVFLKKCDDKFDKHKLHIVTLIVLSIVSVVSNYLPYFGKLMFKNCYTYPVFLMVGMLFGKYEERIKRCINFKCVSVLFGLLHFGMWYMMGKLQSVPIVYYRLLGLLGSAFVLCLSYVFSELCEKKMCKMIEKNSMAVYLFHLPIQYVLLFEITKYCHDALTVALVLLVGSFVLSILSAEFIRFIRCGFLIGEK